MEKCLKENKKSTIESQLSVSFLKIIFGHTVSDIRNNSRQGFQSNQQAQPRQNAPIDQLFGNPMDGMIVAQPPRQNILQSFV